jgi:hypothetical protein
LVTVTLPEGASLDDPEHVHNALSKPYQRVKYYASSPTV